MGELLLGRPDLVGDFAPSEPARASEALRAAASSPINARSSGDPGAELDLTNSACGIVGLLLGLDAATQVAVGDI